MPIDRSMESQVARFEAWLEDRRATYLNGAEDRMLEVAELNAIRHELLRRVDEALGDVDKALFIAQVGMRRAVKVESMPTSTPAPGILQRILGRAKAKAGAST